MTKITRYCPHCCFVKPITSFRIASKNKEQRERICKECRLYRNDDSHRSKVMAKLTTEEIMANIKTAIEQYRQIKTMQIKLESKMTPVIPILEPERFFSLKLMNRP